MLSISFNDSSPFRASASFGVSGSINTPGRFNASRSFATLVFSVALTTLAACGNGDGGGPGIGAASRTGNGVSRIATASVVTETFRAGSSAAPTTALAARFYQTDVAQDIPLPERVAMPGCTVRSESQATSEQDPFDVIADLRAFRTVSAGEALPVVDAEGVSRELLLDDDRDDVINYASPAKEGEISKGAYISVPGDELVVVPDLYLPSVNSIQGLLISEGKNDQLEPDTRIEWQSSEAVGAVALLRFQSQPADVDDTPDGNASGTVPGPDGSSGGDSAEVIHVDCVVPDTGAFELPDDVQAVVREDRFPSSTLSLTRDRYTFEQVGELLILLRARAVGWL